MQIHWLRHIVHRPCGWPVTGLVMAVTALALLQPERALAQVEEDLQLWTQMNLNTHFSEKVLGSLELHPRYRESISEVDQIIIRPSLGYQVNDNLSLWQGYGWIIRPEPTTTNEHRSWQQATWEKRYEKFDLIHRFRFEQRVLEGVDGVSIRPRYMLRTFIPLDKERKWAIVAFNEVFVTLNSQTGGPQGGLDQNRTYIGLSRQLTRNTRLEGCYMLHYVNRPSPTPDGLNHVIYLWLNVNL